MICVCSFHHLRRVRQGIAEHNLKSTEKQAFFIMLTKLAGYYGRLPDSMIITEKIEVEDKILVSDGFSDTRRGRYMGHLVAVKTLRVTDLDDFPKLREVSINDIFSATLDALDYHFPAILQASHPLGHAISSKHLETRWRSGGHGQRPICHCFRVDGARKHHDVH